MHTSMMLVQHFFIFELMNAGLCNSTSILIQVLFYLFISLGVCFQQVFLLHPPFRTSEGDEVNASFLMNRSKENHRLMEVDLGCEIRQSSGKLLPVFRNKFYIE